MTRRQTEIFKRGVMLKNQHGRVEYYIVENLQHAEETKLYLEFGLTSLYLYTKDILNYPKATAYAFITVARKAVQFPDLQKALRSQNLTVSKAARIASTLKPENARDLVEFACSHSMCEINREVARINPRAAGKDSVKDLSDDLVEITVTIPREIFENMKRVEDIHGVSRAEALRRVYEEHLKRHDPVLKAKRNRTELWSTRVGGLNAAEKHAVNSRDEGRCTEVDALGRRCPNRRWIDIHHIVQRSVGGTNAASNLATLCRQHHRAHHKNEGRRPRLARPPKQRLIPNLHLGIKI